MRPTRGAVGRNERCPCGSGRKYKDCCSGRTTLSADLRAEWMVHKLWTFVLRPDRQHHPLALAAMIAADDDDVFDELLDAGVPMDLAAFEGGAAAAYLTTRGPLLTDDDRALLRTWIDTPRRLWRVESVSADSIVLAGVTADGTAGALASLPLAAMRDIAAGVLVLARVVPVGEAHRLVGVWIEVHPDEEAAVLQLTATEPDAVEYARWLGRRV
jgi:hypothetical protein